MKLISIPLVFLLVTAFGCSTVSENRGAATGAGVGAATGAAAGAIFGRSTGAAVIGGLLGALAGGAIGHYGYDQKQNRQETAKTLNYQPSSGNMIKVENVDVSPANVAPGAEVNLGMNYAVLTPSGTAETPITETREITHNGKIVGNPEVRVTRPDGTYTSTLPLQLPANAEKGEYKVRMTVKGPAGSDSRETAFRVG